MLDRIAAQQAHAAELHEPLNNDEVRQYVETYAVNRGIDPVLFSAVARCESGYDTDIRSRHYHKGVRENSWGVFQINLDAHLDVARSQAIDPYFNIKWAADHWDDAAQHWKTCYARANK